MAGDNEAKMEKTVNSLKEEYNTIRTGRASASILTKCALTITAHLHL